MKRIVIAVVFSWVGVVSAAELEAIPEWAGLVALQAGVAGRIQSVHQMAGNRVKQGDLILSLSRPDLLAGKEAADLTVQAAKMDLDEAQRELERAQELYDRTVLSDHALMQAKIALQHAHAKNASAIAMQRFALQQLEWSRITAPFDAYVLKVHEQPGAMVLPDEAAQSLVTIARDDQLWLSVELSASQAGQLRPGKQLSVKVGEQKLNAVVEQIDSLQTNRWRVIVSVKGNPKKLIHRKAFINLP